MLVLIDVATHAHGVIISFKRFMIGALIIFLTDPILFCRPNLDVISELVCAVC
jgi:hypothetical protein